MEPTTSNNVKLVCAYCDEQCTEIEAIHQNDHVFCCFGCATLYDLRENMMHVDWDDKDISIEYKQYDLPEIFHQLVDFENDKIYKLSINAPDIHCSSCVELLEDLPSITDEVFTSYVNYEERKITITAAKSLRLSKLAMLLDKLGYPPQFNLAKKASESQKKTQSELLRKVAVAGFCFGNSMMFSMPHYFGLAITGDAYFVTLFRYLNVALSLVVLGYPARDYFKTAFQAISVRKSHIDIPIVLGIVAIWAWSLYEIFSGIGFGYLDSLAGLIFFLLVGKWYQNKVYSKISFDRSLHDFLPISVRRKAGEEVIWQRVGELTPGDVVVVKNNEVIPVNGKLISGEGLVDYSFVTGESVPESVVAGESIFIGGRQIGSAIEIEILEAQDTEKIWAAWKTPKKADGSASHWTTKVSMYFTPLVLIVAAVSLAAWLYIDASKALFVFSSVLIVACPCALALSTPFTFGSIVRVLSRNKLYLKSADTVEKLAHVDHVIFDKTGTLTDGQKLTLERLQDDLSDDEKDAVYSLCAESNHPYSLRIKQELVGRNKLSVNDLEEVVGKGLQARIGNEVYMLGSAEFVGVNALTGNSSTVYVTVNGTLKAVYHFGNTYRQNIKAFFIRIGSLAKLSVLSGDNDGEKKALQNIYPSFSNLRFNNSPQMKKEFVEEVHAQGGQSLMVGDGLNDQVALHESSVGLAVAQTINGFYPSTDGILVEESFDKLPELLQLSKYSEVVLKASLSFSVFYNLIGISFAVAGSLTPIVAAILMPLSSITVVGLVTALVSVKAKKLQLI